MRRALLALTPVLVTPVLILPAADEPKPGADFPRRMLVVHVGNYLYLNPLTSKAPDGPDRVRDSADRLSEALRVPAGKANGQLFVLSDMLAPPDDRVPTKAAVAAAVRSFCETSRSQDRVLLHFAGHAFEKGGKAYFAPIEGDPNDPATLVPVADLYDMLKGCKATQKVVVWDVCRRNPARPAVRSDAGPMTDALAKALSAAPPGVQVVLSCSPGEFALEYSEPKGDARLFAGSALSDAFRQATEDRAVAQKPDPNDPLPVAEVFPAVEKYVASAAKAYGVKQTPKLVGRRPAQLAAFDPKAVPPGRVEFPAPKAAAVADVKAVLDELALPPLPPGGGSDPVPAALFSADALKPYAPDATIDDILRDVEKYKLRAAVLRALQTIRDTSPWADPRAPKPLTAVTAPVTDKMKKAVLDAQAPLAIAITKLEGELENLTRVGNLRDKEPKRWRAHYDYALGQVRLRLAVLNEYNLNLGHVRTETLPQLPPGATGWRLIHSDKMQSKQPVKDLAADAAAAFEAVVADHKGTPWEVLAKRALLTPPGLKWEPGK
jgi:Caspase domain